MKLSVNAKFTKIAKIRAYEVRNFMSAQSRKSSDRDINQSSRVPLNVD